MNYPIDWLGAPGVKARHVDLVNPDYVPLIKHFFLRLIDRDGAFFLRDQVHAELEAFLEDEDPVDPEAARAVRRLFQGCQEIFLSDPYTYALLRPKIGVKRIVRLHPEDSKFEEVSRYHYLEVKDAFIQGSEEAQKAGLVLDFRPFFRNYPKVKEPRAMGEGISQLNRHLAGQMYQSAETFQRALVRFLGNFQLDGVNLLANDHLNRPETLIEELEAAGTLLAERPRDTPYTELSHELRVLGFEAGWGANAGEIADHLGLLGQVMHSADPARFEMLIGRLPLIKRLVMVSPHGWFAQKDVLGKPDTGGQVTYVLDQARALERQMKQRFTECGIDADPHIIILTRLIPDAEGTTCDMPREKVVGSDNCWIIRVPFRHADETVINHWISRFKIWPYLEAFAAESKSVLTAELMGKPDLVIGHYSDGNLVAHRLAVDLETTHCAAVHALEKTKYLFSDMHWADMEHEYHFSLQFTADIIAYNSADFIISSSYREIGGTDTEMGMFESYETFSMPGLYRVTSGMDPQLARYNIVPPGASEDYFFPHAESDRRIDTVIKRLESLLFSEEPSANAIGYLKNPELPPVFAMSRLDKVKNLPGLVEAYAKSERLRESANLIIMSSITDASQSSDQEEIEVINRLYELIEEYALHGHFRWCAARLDKVETGEIYRVMADRKGAFAQPAHMETFGLTVIEAMACGLPVVVTCFGGPAEIVIDGASGRVVNPNHHDDYANALADIVADTGEWARYSEAGIKRVRDAFSWSAHAARVLQLANIYRYWDYLDVMNRQALDTYIHTLYHTIFRGRAVAMTQED